MHTIVMYPNGRKADGLILAASGDTIRVVIKRRGDTAEFRRVDGVWTSDDGSRVEFETLVFGHYTGAQRRRHFEAGGGSLTA